MCSAPDYPWRINKPSLENAVRLYDRGMYTYSICTPFWPEHYWCSGCECYDGNRSNIYKWIYYVFKIFFWIGLVWIAELCRIKEWINDGHIYQRIKNLSRY